MSGISTFMAGPWGMIADLGPDTSGTGEDRMPNLICNLNIVPGGRNRTQWYNRGCLAPPTFGTWGTANIASFTTPGINNWDISASKATKTRFPKESGEIQFHVDMFNAFNHTQWVSPTQYITSYTSVGNGQVGGTYPARQMEFSLKYLF